MLIATACATPVPARDARVGTGDGAIRAGGTAILAWQEPSTLDPLYSTGTATIATVTALAVEGLLRPGPDGDPEPALAREVPTLANGGVRLIDGAMEVTYRLRDRLVWSDGQPVTGEDVRFTWQAVMNDPKVTSREGYDQIERIDVPEAGTAVVRYRQIYAGYLTRFDALLPAHLLRDQGDAARLAYGRARSMSRSTSRRRTRSSSSAPGSVWTAHRPRRSRPWRSTPPIRGHRTPADPQRPVRRADRLLVGRQDPQAR